MVIPYGGSTTNGPLRRVTVKRGREVFLTPDDLALDISPDTDLCHVQVVTSDPASSRVGTVSPQVISFLVQVECISCIMPPGECANSLDHVYYTWIFQVFKYYVWVYIECNQMYCSPVNQVYENLIMQFIQLHGVRSYTATHSWSTCPYCFLLHFAQKKTDHKLITTSNYLTIPYNQPTMINIIWYLCSQDKFHSILPAQESHKALIAPTVMLFFFFCSETNSIVLISIFSNSKLATCLG